MCFISGKTGTDLFFETGGRLNTAIREDASMNLAAIDDLQSRHPNLELVLVESGGDKLL